MDSATIQLIAVSASVVLATSTVISVSLAVWSYRRTAAAQVRNAEAQFQLLALSTLQHYLDLAVAHPELATRADDQPVDASYAWFAAQAMTTAQILRELVGNQADWERSINAIVRHHRSYLRSGAFVCDDFSPAFVSYLRERVPGLSCADA